MAVTDMPSAAPSRKVLASGAGGGFALLLADFVIWLLDTYLFDPAVVDSVPGPVAALVLGAFPLAAAVLAGYYMPRSADELEPAEPLHLGQHVRLPSVDEVADGFDRVIVRTQRRRVPPTPPPSNEAGSTRSTDAIVAVILLFFIACCVLAVIGAVR